MISCSSQIATLSREINKIVSAPYAVIFKTLCHILNNTSDDQIYLWTVIKGCQLEALIARILAALGRDEAAWWTFLKLVRHRAVRDEVIKQDPATLSLLFADTEKHDVFETCLAVCRYPFPDSFSPPQEYFDFVDSVLVNFHEESQDSWVEHAHDLLAATSVIAISTIDDNTMRKCIRLWNESSKATGNATFIRFLSIAAVVHRNYADCQPGSSCDTISSPTSIPLSAWIAKCSSFFRDQKALKIIRSILLRTLYILSEKNVVQESEVANCLNMIRRVLEAMNKDILHVAVQDPETVQVLMKMVQKSTQQSTSSRVRLCLCGIFLVVDPRSRHWDSSLLHSFFEQCTYNQSDQRSDVNLNSLPQTLFDLKFQSEQQDLFSLAMKQVLRQRSVFEAMMQHIINLCRPGTCNTPDLMCSLQSASMFMNNVSELVTSGQPNGDVVDCLVALEIPDWWNWTLCSPRKLVTCCKLDICPHVKDQFQWQLTRCISGNVVRAASISENRLSQSDFGLLQEAICQHDTGEANYRCPWPRVVRQDHNQLLATIAPVSAEARCNTHNPLETVLTSISEQSSRAIREYVEDVCRDLQLRCRSVEAPLRAEQAKCNDLEQELLEARSSAQVMLAEHQARRLSWQHAIEVEQNEVVTLKMQQSEMQQSLQKLHEEVRHEAERTKSAESAFAELNEQFQALQKDLEQEKLRTESLRCEQENMTSERETMERQLQEARDKQQRLLSVLNGGQDSIL